MSRLVWSAVGGSKIMWSLTLLDKGKYNLSPSNLQRIDLKKLGWDQNRAEILSFVWN